MAETGLTRNQAIAELLRSPHGNLLAYAPTGRAYAEQDPDFFAHLVAYNHVKGQVRDAKVALPVLSLDAGDRLLTGDAKIAVVENALAHLADLSPKMLVQALAFTRELKSMASRRMLRRLVTRYLREKETDWRGWERTALQHREAMRTLYAQWHVAPGGIKGSLFDETLLRGAATVGKFAAVKTLAGLPAADIAEAMRRYRLPFLVARGALGARAKEPDVALALLQSMSPAEVVTNLKALERLGVKAVPELRAALEQALDKAGTSKKLRGTTLKATRAAETLEADGEDVLAGKLRTLQERQLDTLGGVEGNWLVLGDKSSSMATAIELARQVAGILARMVKGNVHLVFFDTYPQYVDVTGQTYEQIKALTALVQAGGNTSLGCGLDLLVQKKIEVDGIAIVSDGGHNQFPTFSAAMGAYRKLWDRTPACYLFRTPGDTDRFTADCQAAEIDLQVFDLRPGGTHAQIDFYSLPALVQTLRVSKYALTDEIYAAPLRRLDEALPKTAGTKVLVGETLVPA